MIDIRYLINLIESSNSQSDVVVWHVTPSSSVPKIMQRGLTPRRGVRRVNEQQNAIYVFPDSTSLIDALSNWLGDEFEDIPISLLELTVPNEWLDHHSVRWEAAITRPVPPNRIRVLVANLDDWNGDYPGGNPPNGWFPLD